LAVPAGSYSTIEVFNVTVSSSGSQTQYTRYWFAADVGMVRKDFSTSDFPTVRTEVLWSSPLAVESSSWGSLKALYR
jgi:hypothetical protein